MIPSMILTKLLILSSLLSLIDFCNMVLGFGVKASFLFRVSPCRENLHHPSFTIPCYCPSNLYNSVTKEFNPESFVSSRNLSGEETSDYIKEMATDALMEVFYGKENSDSNYEISNVSAEKALKKKMREFQQKINNSMIQLSSDERQNSRKMLADLVLGTSIMRIRHFHAVSFAHDRIYSTIIEPIFGLEGSLKCCNNKKPSNEVAAFRRSTVRSMVNLHIEYMLLQQSGASNSVKEAKKSAIDQGAFRFRSATHRISVMNSLPEFFIQMLVEQYGESKTEEMAIVFNEAGPITLRRNKVKCDSNDLLCRRLQNDGLVHAFPLSMVDSGLQSNFTAPSGCVRMQANESWSPAKKSLWSMEAWKDGWFEVQDTGSQLIVEATEAKGGECVIDYCAGNGGKTLALASIMHNNFHCDKRLSGSLIIANDVVDIRLKQIIGSLKRAGLSDDENPLVSIKTTLDKDINLEDGMADVVLVDAPCSSTGVLRRRPSQRYMLNEEDIAINFPLIQEEILMNASNLVKSSGGRLVYATCSISTHENDEIVTKFENHDGFRENWERWHFDDESDNIFSHCRATVPTAGGCDGFFIARWKRR